MDKVLFLGSESKDDPGFDSVQIEGKPYKEYMKEKGIKVIDKILESCYGCHDLMKDYSIQMQSMVEEGNKVVAVLEGGLSFGLPSIQATQVTYPIISVPMDMVSFTSFMVRTKNGAVAGVGVPEPEEVYGQKEKALRLAAEMLNLESKAAKISDNDGKLEKELAKYDIKIDPASRLAINYGIYRMDIAANNSSLMIRADPDEDIKSWGYLKEAEKRHHESHFNYVPTAQVNGIENLAIYTAKILSLQIPGLREKILETAANKRVSYERRYLVAEIRTGEVK